MTGLEPTVLHVVVGPEQHGVVRHGALVAHASGDRLVRLNSPTEPLTHADLAGVDLIHLPYTDRLFAATATESAATVERLVRPWLDAGLALSVTLHDLPAGDSDWDRRREAAYRRVVALASGVVVNSWRELELVQRLLGVPGPRSLRCVPLPLEPVLPVPDTALPDTALDDTALDDTALDQPTGTDVVVLGFVFPDRGYEHTLDELPAEVDLVALGRPSAGHEDLPAALAKRAAATGHTMTVTGFVADADLGPALRAAAVPVAPNRRVAASASINTWIAHGRRPLVPDSPYARELAVRTPGTVITYDADEPGALRAAITAALADPALTRLTSDAVVAPGVAEVADRYRLHFAGCLAPAPIRVGERHLIVPGNGWDLLKGVSAEPTVSVVIPHHEAQAHLDLVLTALTLQTHPRTRLEVVVADDGSRTAPSTAAAGDLEISVVRQPRDGFRAAAARNLGATAATGEVLVFLDGDTVPAPDYVARLVRLPGLVPDALTVGRRRHADLTGWTPDRLTGWLTGGDHGPAELPEPEWLRQAYADTGDLRHADHRSYRWVISAVTALSRDLFTELGGFDETFHAYGGEDWELAHRAWVAGAVLAHEPRAVAWHDGPDWGGRSAAEKRGAKNAETLTLARLLPDPEARGGGQWRRPAVAVELAFVDPVAVLATARAAFAQDADVGVWVDHADAEDTVRRLDDPRIRPGRVPAEIRTTAQALLRLDGPARVTGVPELLRLAGRHGPLTLPTGTLVPTRATGRSTRWAGRLGVSPDLLAARLFGGRDLPAPWPSAPVDLAHELKYVYASTRSTASVNRS